MSDAGQGGAPKRSWAKPALVISLALNLLLIGLIAGSFWKRHHNQWRPHNIVLEKAIQQLMGELPEEKRAAGQRALQNLRSQGPKTWDDIRNLRKEASDAMMADQYDEQRFADALARLRDAHNEKRRVRHQVVIDFIRGMTPEERRRFIEIYKENRRGPWDRDKYWKK